MKIARAHAVDPWNDRSSLVVAGLSQIVCIVLRVLAQACKMVRQIEAANCLSYQAKKFYAIHVRHNIHPSTPPALLLLARTRNIAKRAVIASEEDRKVACLMREQFFRSGGEAVSRLQCAKLRCATSKGICYGATLNVIDCLLQANPQSEQALIAIIEQFEGGFDAKGAALQAIYHKTYGLIKKMLDEWRDSVDELGTKIMEQIDTVQDISTLHKQSLHESAQFHTTFDKKMFGYWARLSSLIGLTLETITQCAAHDNQLDTLAPGHYELGFSAKTNAHAVALLKYSFGSYILDPNYGLLRIASTRDAIKILIHHYKGDQAKNITISKLIKA